MIADSFSPSDQQDDAAPQNSSPCAAADATVMPAWLQASQNYQARKDRDRFLRKNTLRLTATLSNLKVQRGGLTDAADLPLLDRALTQVDCAFRIFGVFTIILCVSAASNMFFVYSLLALLLVMLALKPGDEIIDIIKPALGALLFSLLLMAPAVFFGQPGSMIRIPLKVFITVALVINLSSNTAWNQLVAGLRAFRIPALVIFVLDITLKYIIMLGDVALGVLDALTLRSVGKNREKSSAASGVIGITFLKAHDYGAEMYEAMECRGFTGEYVIPKHKRVSAAGIIYLLCVVALIVWFLFLEGII